LGTKFPIFDKARRDAQERMAELDQILSREVITELSDYTAATDVSEYSSTDTNVVVFGSIARGEWTGGSDLDWTYLIDGGANSDHLLIAQAIGRVLNREEYKKNFRPPGRSGTFGNMAFSHDIVHQIGGQYDTNKK